jgi:hypothetical protein
MPATAADIPASTLAPAGLSSLIPGFQPPADGRVRGIVLAGLDDPELLTTLLRALPRSADGYETPVYIVAPTATLPTELTPSDRVRIFTGDRAVDDFLADRRAAITLSLPRSILQGGSGAAGWLPRLNHGLAELSRQQQALDHALRAKLDNTARTRGMAHWHARFSAIVSGRSPARVLILTSRYSTFVRHAGEDLAAALGELGHDARVLMEPTPHATLTSCHYLHEIDQFDPDMLVGINYPRASLGNALPEGWPYVCWVQDAMPHLFTGAARATALDFVIGHAYAGALERQGYAAGRVLPHPVPVSETKFRPRGRTQDRDARFTCDIAYVSHRSETPAAFHARFLRESGMQGPAAAALERCRAAVADAVSRWATEPSGAELIKAAQSMAQGLGKAGDARIIDLLRHQYVLPLAEQLLRHETLEWAALIARDEGLTLKIFGKGWEAHPTLAEFTAGPLTHGEDLRDCYQSAACHLHASPLGVNHQRVFECAMSGGVALCRRSWEELYHHDWIESRSFILERIEPDLWRNNPRWPVHTIANHPRLMKVIRDRQRMIRKPGGWDHEFHHGQYAHIEFPGVSYDQTPLPPPYMRAYTILGDILETTFSTPDELRERILLAAKRGTWRDQISTGISARARDAVGMHRFADRMLGLVGHALAPSAAPPAEAAA